MSETICATLPLTRWQGERGTYHLVTFTGGDAETITMHARLLTLELGTRRGFGSVKATVRIGDTRWQTSLFPQGKSREWVLLVSKKVMQAEALSHGDEISVAVELR